VFPCLSSCTFTSDGCTEVRSIRVIAVCYGITEDEPSAPVGEVALVSTETVRFKKKRNIEDAYLLLKGTCIRIVSGTAWAMVQVGRVGAVYVLACLKASKVGGGCRDCSNNSGKECNRGATHIEERKAESR